MTRTYPPLVPPPRADDATTTKDGTWQSTLQSSTVTDAVAGFVAGVAQTLGVHPLDVVKTRLQGRFTTHALDAQNPANICFHQPIDLQKANFGSPQTSCATCGRMKDVWQVSIAASCQT
jgi:hypothetical protein